MSHAMPPINELLTDEAMAQRWERIIRIENLQADTGLKLAQAKVQPWQLFSFGATATAAIVGLAIAFAHWL